MKNLRALCLLLTLVIGLDELVYNGCEKCKKKKPTGKNDSVEYTVKEKNDTFFGYDRPA